MIGNFLLVAKAEMVVGSLLVMRNRTFRVVCAMAVAMLVLVLISNPVQSGGNRNVDTILVLTGTLAAVAGSRLLAPGGALAATRQVAAFCWVAPLGRLAGAFALVFPFVVIVALSLGTLEYGLLRLSFVAAFYASAVASGVMALAPATGATAASAAAFVVVLVGAMPSSDLNGMFETRPFLHHALVGMWYSLPLHWRAVHLLDTGNLIDAVVLSAWTVIGVVVAALVSKPVWPSPRGLWVGS